MGCHRVIRVIAPHRPQAVEQLTNLSFRNDPFFGSIVSANACTVYAF
jgi:hypothetical protein